MIGKVAVTLGLAVLAPGAAGGAPAQYVNPTAGAVLALQLPGMHRAQVQRRIVYRRSPALRMDVYRPRGVARTRELPAVLIGGPPAFNAGKDSGQKIGWSQLVAASGMAAVTFDIRSDGFLERPAQPAADVAAAVAYVRTNAARLGIDASRLCTLGFSIGTAPWHLAAVMREPMPEVRCNVVFYGPLDFESPAWRDLGGDPAKLTSYAAATYLRQHGSRIAPMLVAKAGREGNRGINESIDRFLVAAREAAAPVRVVTHATGGHGFDVSVRNARTRTILREAIAFFRTHLLAPRAPASTLTARPPLQLTDPCVSRAERRRAVRFTASDGTRLIGLIVGSGPRGVVLAHQGGSNLCRWLPYARTLAAGGYRVFVFDHRNFGSSGSARTVPNLFRVDLDVVAAVKELRRRGASSVVLGGASLGGAAVLAAASRIQPAVQGVISFSSPQTFVRVDALAAVRRLVAPVLFVAAEFDEPFDDDARALHAAAASTDKRLEIVPGGEHGAPMLRNAVVRSMVGAWIAAHSSA